MSNSGDGWDIVLMALTWHKHLHNRNIPRASDAEYYIKCSRTCSPPSFTVKTHTYTDSNHIIHTSTAHVAPRKQTPRSYVNKTTRHLASRIAWRLSPAINGIHGIQLRHNRYADACRRDALVQTNYFRKSEGDRYDAALRRLDGEKLSPFVLIAEVCWRWQMSASLVFGFV